MTTAPVDATTATRRRTALRQERVRAQEAHTCGVIFAIDARWSFGQAIQPKTEAAFNSAFRPDDEAVCAWIDGPNREVLRVAFDLEASAFELAIEEALAELRRAASDAALPGRPVEAVDMTNEGHARWRE